MQHAPEEHGGDRALSGYDPKCVVPGGYLLDARVFQGDAISLRRL
jgi:hypothetical protein